MALDPSNQNKTGIVLPNQDGTYDSAYPAGDKPVAAYTPVLADTWGDGVVGNSVANFNARNAGTVTYSDDVASPFGNSIVGKMDIATNENNFGGNFPVGSNLVVNEGDDIWIRWFNYFPSSFCAGFGTAGDGYGRTKWIRFGFASTGQRLTLQLGGFTGQSCSVDDLYFAYVSNEIGGSGNEYFKLAGIDQQGTVARDQWVRPQMRIKFSENPAIGFAQLWMGSTFIGQTDNFQTKPVGDNTLNDITVGDYWNGWAYQASSWYHCETVITKEQPTTVDSGGRPFISPLISASAFS